MDTVNMQNDNPHPSYEALRSQTLGRMHLAERALRSGLSEIVVWGLDHGQTEEGIKETEEVLSLLQTILNYRCLLPESPGIPIIQEAMNEIVSGLDLIKPLVDDQSCSNLIAAVTGLCQLSSGNSTLWDGDSGLLLSDNKPALKQISEAIVSLEKGKEFLETGLNFIWRRRFLDAIAKLHNSIALFDEGLSLFQEGIRNLCFIEDAGIESAIEATKTISDNFIHILNAITDLENKRNRAAVKKLQPVVRVVGKSLLQIYKGLEQYASG